MNNINAEHANTVVQQCLKTNKKRVFNETGIRFDGDIWAFPNNRKIFIGVYDFTMDDKTYAMTVRAMFRNAISEKLKNPRVIIACGLGLIYALAVAGSVYKVVNKVRRGASIKKSQTLSSARSTNNCINYQSVHTR